MNKYISKKVKDDVESIICDMRDTTQEEQTSINTYTDSISTIAKCSINNMEEEFSEDPLPPLTKERYAMLFNRVSPFTTKTKQIEGDK